MSKGLDVFGVSKESLNFELENSVKVIEDKLNPSWIKQRTQGKATLSYIGGHTVIRLLNKAFNYQWSFEIVSEEVMQSIPKVNKYKNNEIEPQAPVAKVLGRLTVPGVGVREQYGSKVLVGGATEQESAFKSASTDALKKCASLFGIGLELYGEDEGLVDSTEYYEAEVAPAQVQTEPTRLQVVPEPTIQSSQSEQPVNAPTAAKQEAQSATNIPEGGWNPHDINRLKELKAILGISDNSQLDPYVKEFFDNGNVTWSNITPDNIKAVNIFLTKKAQTA